MFALKFVVKKLKSYFRKSITMALICKRTSSLTVDLADSATLLMKTKNVVIKPVMQRTVICVILRCVGISSRVKFASSVLLAPLNTQLSMSILKMKVHLKKPLQRKWRS